MLNGHHFDKSKALLGEEGFAFFCNRRIVIFGVGGVGSWCAEALVRTGINQLTIVDDDVVSETNINRQLPATSLTIGKDKVAVLKERFTEINPDIQVEAIKKRYTPDSDFFDDAFFNRHDIVIDAIDSVTDKAHLIRRSMRLGLKLYSSMGAALRTDPTLVRTANFNEINGDGLAKALRNRFKKDTEKTIPTFPCVYSIEPPKPNKEHASLVTVTAAFGLTLASFIINNAKL